jgi:hypothetical protein
MEKDEIRTLTLRAIFASLPWVAKLVYNIYTNFKKNRKKASHKASKDRHRNHGVSHITDKPKSDSQSRGASS